VIAFVSLAAIAGYSLVGQQTSAQGAQLAVSLAGGEFSIGPDEQTQLPESRSSDLPADPAISALDYAKGVVGGIYENLLNELSIFTSPLETLEALYTLGVMLAEDLAGTARQLLDELLLEPLDTLANGTPYEQGYVVGEQISPTKALSVVSKLALVGAVVAPAKRISNQIVLGHSYRVEGNPSYTELADSLGARYFQVPDDAWDRMSEAQRYEANFTFIDRAIARGDEIVLSTPAGLAAPGSIFEAELEYLGSQGYIISPDGRRAIPREGG